MNRYEMNISHFPRVFRFVAGESQNKVEYWINVSIDAMKGDVCMIKLCLASQPIIMVLTRVNLSVMPNISPIFRDFTLKRGWSKCQTSKLRVYAHRLSALVLGVLVTGRPLAEETVQRSHGRFMECQN